MFYQSAVILLEIAADYEIKPYERIAIWKYFYTFMGNSKLKMFSHITVLIVDIIFCVVSSSHIYVW